MAHWLVYGGTFDPIHHGHLITCRRARELLRADGVVLIPANVSPHKTDGGAGASGADRRAMIEAAIAGQADFSVDWRELGRAGPSYTVDTVREIAAERGGDALTVLVGADQLAKLETWHRFGELLELARVAVLRRPGVDAVEGLRQVHARMRAAGLGEKAERVAGVETPEVEISATGIRARVRAGLAISFWVPAGVEAYVRRAGLYGGR